MIRAVSSVVFGIIVGLWLCDSHARASAPQSIVGVRLGSQIEEIKDLVDLSSAVPVWGSRYLMRAPLRPVRGYQSGYVVYGDCAHPGRVVRIKLTYEDASEAFYNQLHSAITKRYGKPTEWRGNPFGTLRIWKWSLRDPEGRRVSIILQHYVGDDDSFTPGNSIRLTHNSFIDEETACHQSKKEEQKVESHPALMPERIDFEWFLPR